MEEISALQVGNYVAYLGTNGYYNGRIGKIELIESLNGENYFNLKIRTSDESEINSIKAHENQLRPIHLRDRLFMYLGFEFDDHYNIFYTPFVSIFKIRGRIHESNEQKGLSISLPHFRIIGGHIAEYASVQESIDTSVMIFYLHQVQNFSMRVAQRDFLADVTELLIGKREEDLL